MAKSENVYASKIQQTISDDSFVLDVVKGIIGYGLLICWQTIMIWSVETIPSEVYSDFNAHCFRAAFLFAIAFILLILSIFPVKYKLQRNYNIVAECIISAVSSAPMILMFFHFPFTFVITFWGLAGIADAALLSMWCRYLVSLNQKQSMTVVSAAFVVAGLAFLLFLGTRSPFQSIFAVCLPVVSLTLCLSSLYFAEARLKKYHKNIRSQPEKKTSFIWERDFSTTCNVLTGFSASCLTSALFTFSPSLFIGCVLVCSGVTICLILFKIRRNATSLFFGVLIPFMAIQFFAFAFGNEIFQVIATLLMFYILSCFDILSTSNLSRKVRYLFDDYGKHLMRCRAYNRIAFCGGWIAGLLAIAFNTERINTLLFFSFILFCFLALVVCLNLYRLLLIAQGWKTKRDEGRIAEFIYSGSWKSHEKFPKEKSQNNSNTVTENAIFNVADKYKLTVREREVFSYLARGRDAEYISEVLVISINTTRTHIYNIYGKLGVHSKQELINIVEKNSR